MPANEGEFTFGRLRSMIADQRLGWLPPRDRGDDAEVRRHGLGADPESVVSTADVADLDLASLGMSPNPCLAVRQAERGITPRYGLTGMLSEAMLRRLGSRRPTAT